MDTMSDIQAPFEIPPNPPDEEIKRVAKVAIELTHVVGVRQFRALKPDSDVQSLATALADFDAVQIARLKHEHATLASWRDQPPFTDAASPIDTTWSVVDRFVAEEVRRLFAAAYRLDVPGDIVAGSGFPKKDGPSDTTYVDLLLQHRGDQTLVRRIYRERALREALQRAKAIDDERRRPNGSARDRLPPDKSPARVERLVRALSDCETDFSNIAAASLGQNQRKVDLVPSLRGVASRAGKLLLETDGTDPLPIASSPDSWLSLARSADAPQGFRKFESPGAISSLSAESFRDAMIQLAPFQRLIDDRLLSGSADDERSFLHRHTFLEFALRTLPAVDGSLGAAIELPTLSLGRGDGFDFHLITDCSLDWKSSTLVVRMTEVARQLAAAVRLVIDWLTRDQRAGGFVIGEVAAVDHDELERRREIQHDASLALRDPHRYPQDLHGKVRVWGIADHAIIRRFPIDVAEGIALGSIRFASADELANDATPFIPAKRRSEPESNAAKDLALIAEAPRVESLSDLESLCVWSIKRCERGGVTRCGALILVIEAADYARMFGHEIDSLNEDESGTPGDIAWAIGRLKAIRSFASGRAKRQKGKSAETPATIARRCGEIQGSIDFYAKRFGDHTLKVRLPRYSQWIEIIATDFAAMNPKHRIVAKAEVPTRGAPASLSTVRALCQQIHDAAVELSKSANSVAGGSESGPVGTPTATSGTSQRDRIEQLKRNRLEEDRRNRESKTHARFLGHRVGLTHSALELATLLAHPGLEAQGIARQGNFVGVEPVATDNCEVLVDSQELARRTVLAARFWTEYPGIEALPWFASRTSAKGIDAGRAIFERALQGAALGEVAEEVAGYRDALGVYAERGPRKAAETEFGIVMFLADMTQNLQRDPRQYSDDAAPTEPAAPTSKSTEESQGADSGGTAPGEKGASTEKRLDDMDHALRGLADGLQGRMRLKQISEIIAKAVPEAQCSERTLRDIISRNRIEPEKMGSQNLYLANEVARAFAAHTRAKKK